MKVYMDKDEWWPVYSFIDPEVEENTYLQTVEITPELFQEWKDANKIFREVQQKMAKVWRDNQELTK